jgi:hypothetical protein
VDDASFAVAAPGRKTTTAGRVRVIRVVDQPAGELVAAALAMAARFEWRRISERQTEKHAALRRAGRPRGRQAASSELAAIVEALRAEGLSFAAIAAKLERRHIPTVRGGARWHPASVRSVLRTRQAELAAPTA